MVTVCWTNREGERRESCGAERSKICTVRLGGWFSLPVSPSASQSIVGMQANLASPRVLTYPILCLLYLSCLDWRLWALDGLLKSRRTSSITFKPSTLHKVAGEPIDPHHKYYDQACPLFIFFFLIHVFGQGCWSLSIHTFATITLM